MSKYRNRAEYPSSCQSCPKTPHPLFAPFSLTVPRDVDGNVSCFNIGLHFLVDLKKET